LKIIKHHLLTKQLRKYYNPEKDPNTTDDPRRTLFIRNLPFDVDDLKLYHKMKAFGSVKDVRVVRDKNGRSRGYAFVQFKHKNDMKHAYRDAHGIKINGRKIKVDYEKGRNNDKWYPRRLGGGKGGRIDIENQNKRQKVIEEFEKGEFDDILDRNQLKLEVKQEAKHG
jgi:U1 small nuclear ribonucleoprotein 70kDa